MHRPVGQEVYPLSWRGIAGKPSSPDREALRRAAPRQTYTGIFQIRSRASRLPAPLCIPGKSAAADGATKSSNNIIERRIFTLNIMRRSEKYQAQLAPSPICRIASNSAGSAPLEDAARDAFEIYSLIVRTTLEVGRVSVIGPFNCFRMASS